MFRDAYVGGVEFVAVGGIPPAQFAAKFAAGQVPARGQYGVLQL